LRILSVFQKRFFNKKIINLCKGGLKIINKNVVFSIPRSPLLPGRPGAPGKPDKPTSPLGPCIADPGNPGSPFIPIISEFSGL